MCSQSVAWNYKARKPPQRDIYDCSAAVRKDNREASPILAKVLLYLAKCAAVDEGLSVLPSDEKPRAQSEGEFASGREPLRDESSIRRKVVEETKARSGEIIDWRGDAAVSQLGLTRQLIVRAVMLEFGVRSTGDPLLFPASNFVSSNRGRRRGATKLERPRQLFERLRLQQSRIWFLLNELLSGCNPRLRVAAGSI